jgi:enediyne biosynthesis protein E4
MNGMARCQRILLAAAGCAVALFAVGCSNAPDPDTTVPAGGSSRTGASIEPTPARAEPHRVAIGAEAPGSAGNMPRAEFQLIEVPPERSGIAFVHVSGNAQDKPFPAANGSGVGALDFDLDGWYDLYFATGTSFPLDANRRTPSNRMYRNLGGWRFEDVSAATGLDYNGYSAGIAVGDYDSDGFPDVYVTCFGRNQLYRNQGDGTFENVSASVPDGGNFSTSAAFFDVDGDGLLDLYVCNYGNWSYEHNAFCGDRTRGVRTFCSPKSLEAERDVLLLNQGDGTFRDITVETGIDAVAGRGQGVLAADVNDDGRIDLYIGNDIHPNALSLNEGNLRFRDISELSGTAYDRSGRMQAGMGVAGADINRDGLWDLLVTNFEGEHHTLYLQSAPEIFHDVSEAHDIAAASRPWVGWGAAFVDFDLDGWKELIVANGHVDDNLKEMGGESPYEHPALIWKNDAGRFRSLGERAGSYFSRPHPGRGLATVDLDNDGDSDLVIVHQDQPPALLRNDGIAPRVVRDSVVIRLIGTESNRDAVGTRVAIVSQIAPRIEQVQGGGSYLSAQDLRLIVAAENDDRQINVEIRWPSGRISSIAGMSVGEQYDVFEPPTADEWPRFVRQQFKLTSREAAP